MKNKTRILITTLAAVFVVFGLFKIAAGNRVSTSSVPEVPIVEPTPTPEPTPQHPLKDNERFIGPAKLYIQIPDGMTFRQESANDPGRSTSVGFYIENEDYTFYGLFQDTVTTEHGMEQMKKEMVPNTIEEAVVGGYRGFAGLITGPKERYLTAIIKDDKLITFSTIPATEENKAITEQILSSVSFDK